MWRWIKWSWKDIDQIIILGWKYWICQLQTEKYWFCQFKGYDWVYIWTLGVIAIVCTNENNDVDNYDGGQDGKMVNIE